MTTEIIEESRINEIKNTQIYSELSKRLKDNGITLDIQNNSVGYVDLTKGRRKSVKMSILIDINNIAYYPETKMYQMQGNYMGSIKTVNIYFNTAGCIDQVHIIG
jgi:hypothetical protein